MPRLRPRAGRTKQQMPTVFGPGWINGPFGIQVPSRGVDIFVDTFNGSAGANGYSWDTALSTMAAALDKAETHDRIFFVGDVREEIDISDITDLNLKFDVSIIGCGSLHHPDQPGSAPTLYDYGAAMWRPPATPTSATELLEVYGRGWNFVNIAFDCPVDAAAVKLNSNALSGTSEYDASHASFWNCTFQQGLYGIQDAGGVVNVTIRECGFRIMSPTGAKAIVNTSTAVRTPQFWRILDCEFPGVTASGGNECHIDAPLAGSIIKNSVFGLVEGTALYIDLTGGDDNIVTGNYLSGSYDTSDYVAGTNDGWSGNITADISGNAAVDASGITIAVPAAP